MSLTHEGKTHDKALADAEALDLPGGLLLRQDPGDPGNQPAGVVVSQPQKKPRKGTLTDEQKALNQAISAKRVVIGAAPPGGIKHLHCLSWRLRLRGRAIRHQVMRVGTALHNFRVSSPCR